MKWYDYLIIIVFPILLAIINSFYLSFFEAPYSTFIRLILNLYLGVLIYLMFKLWSKPALAVKKLIIIGVLNTILTFIINHLARNLKQLVSSSIQPGGEVLSMFEIVPLGVVIVAGLIFILIPLLISYLETRSEFVGREFVRSNLLVAIYLILSIGFYQLHWFNLIQKDFNKYNIKTISLWWFAVPVAGPVLVYLSFSEALERTFGEESVVYFLLLFFLSGGLNILIIQAQINQKYKELIHAATIVSS